MSESRRERRLAGKADRKAQKKAEKRNPEPSRLRGLPHRECGSCTACCTAVGVPELEKPRGTQCSHVCKQGCGIYADRPKSCQVFDCLWKQGIFEAEHRPDQLGVVFTVTGQGSVLGRQCVVVHESWPGGFENARRVLQVLSETQLVILIGKDASRRLMGPPHLLVEAQRVLNRTLPVLQGS